MSAGILKYFSIVDKRKRLPDPAGPLSRTIPSSSIAACNKEVEAVSENGHHSGIKGPWNVADNDVNLLHSHCERVV